MALPKRPPSQHPPPAPLLLSLRRCPLNSTRRLLCRPCQVRDHFENNAEAKALLKQVKSFKVTK